VHRSLADHVGDTVYVRFSLIAGALGSDDGWYLDNIGLTDSVASVEQRAAEPAALLVVSPNPATDRIDVQVQTFEPATSIQLELVDMMGRVVTALKSLVYSELPQRYTFDVGTLPNGVYVVRCSTVRGTCVQTFTIAR
jgi:hypothetical protein